MQSAEIAGEKKDSAEIGLKEVRTGKKENVERKTENAELQENTQFDLKYSVSSVWGLS